MRISLTIVSVGLLALVCLGACATHPKDFISNGATEALPPTNPANIKVLDSIPRGMVIGTVLVDRSKAHDTNEIIEMAREKAASVGADFIVWEDSMGTAPSPSATPGAPAPVQDTGSLGHGTAAVPDQNPELTTQKTPKARFTVGIFLAGGAEAH